MEPTSEQPGYRPDWESLEHYTVPEWYQDGKFGIFIHWGVYSVPAFNNEWYPRNMYLKGTPEFEHHLQTYGPHSRFGYKDFIPQFTNENFDPEIWAHLFKESGARFVVPVAEHHDGFALYDCSFSRWTSTRMGPKRDLLGDLAGAIREQGLVFGLSSHRAEHWWFMNGGREYDSDVNDPQLQDFYGPATPMEGYPEVFFSQPFPDEAFLEDWLARTCELVDKYRPQLVWFDWWIGHQAFAPYLPRFTAYYYNRGVEWGGRPGSPGVAINYKYMSIPDGVAVLDVERGQLKDIRSLFWQTDTSISKNSWGYVKNQDYKAAGSIIGDLVDIVSKNGALLLNIGPRPDGTIPEPEVDILQQIGAWLSVNGEAIYGTRPWRIYGEGPTEINEGAFTDTARSVFTGEDYRFTHKDKAIYAIALAWPGESALIKAFGTESPYSPGRVSHVGMLGDDSDLAWSQDSNGLVIKTPAIKPCKHAFGFKINYA